VSCAPSGDEGPTVYIVIQISEILNEIRTNEKKKKERGKSKQKLCKSESEKKKVNMMGELQV
jgi:hypothetical protein